MFKATSLLRLFAVALLTMLALASPAAADDHDDDDDDDDRFGAYIHDGACDDLGREVEDIDELDRDHHEDRDDDHDDHHDRIHGQFFDDGDAPDRFWSENDDVDMSLDELNSGDYVVTVHEGDDSDTPVVACGVIEGELDEEGGLLIDLEEHEESGYEGRAYLMPDNDDDDDDDTDVHVGLWEVQSAGV